MDTLDKFLKINQNYSIEVRDSINFLIKKCKRDPEFDKNISMKYVKPMVEKILELYNKNNHPSLLNLLAVILYHYPESCGRFQSNIGKVISSSLDYKDFNLIKASAKCYALLVRAIERQFVNTHKENLIIPENNGASCHLYHQIILCQSLSNIINQLFQNCIITVSTLPTEIQFTKNDHDFLQLPDISSEDLFKYYDDNVNRFVNVCNFLCDLLRVGNSGRKFVLPNVILQVVGHGLSITPANLQKTDESKKHLLLPILPKLHIGLLNVLEALISSFQQELIPFSFNILKLILQTLDWTKSQDNEIYNNVRVKAYNTLSTWMKQTRSLSGFQSVADEVLSHILNDISQTNNKTIQTLKLNKNNKTKIDDENFVVDTNEKLNRDYSILRLQALATIDSVISNASCFLKQSFYERIGNIVVSTLNEHYMNKSSSRLDQNDRLQMLRTLRILEMFIKGSSLTPKVIYLFNLVDKLDGNAELKAEACLGLAELGHVVYPSAPTLMLPKENTDDQQNLKKNESSKSLCLDKIFTSNQLENKRSNSLDKPEDDDASAESKRPKLNEKNSNDPILSFCDVIN